MVDTNVLSDLFRGSPSTRAFLNEFESLSVSMIVLGELLFGFVGGSREMENRHRLDQFLAQPNVNVLPVSSYAAEYYALIMNQLRKNGTPLPTHDVWIAALACSEKIPLVSRDKHFLKISGLQVVVPE